MKRDGWRDIWRNDILGLCNLFRTALCVDEFLPWAEAQERGRYELHDGRVIMVSPERAAHWKVKLDAVIALRDAIKAAGLGCHAVPDRATVRISTHTAFEPDALV
jgi:Uma2 family endonuclease